MGKITITGLDATNPTDLDRAATVVRSLHLRAKDRTGDVRIEFDNGVAVVEFEASPVVNKDPVPVVNPHLVGFVYGKKTREFLDAMLATIRSHGGVTLEDAAAQHGIGIDTARAFIRNAGRTAKAHGATLPVKPTWDHDRGCNVYTAA